ncbi:hypothetical protein PoB_004971400 [Plakobranchus ocellatus]|uniref:Uncharacterized protein n=1 Tax=Plakobranchus ocellatus TaxID=259542 RepID=A0AAV4BSQ6_9GAST|nr:hypothetical protein PoB_004971400 [Plakobranchus ocellatus]
MRILSKSSMVSEGQDKSVIKRLRKLPIPPPPPPAAVRSVSVVGLVTSCTPTEGMRKIRLLRELNRMRGRSRVNRQRLAVLTRAPPELPTIIINEIKITHDFPETVIEDRIFGSGQQIVCYRLLVFYEIWSSGVGGNWKSPIQSPVSGDSLQQL